MDQRQTVLEWIIEAANANDSPVWDRGANRGPAKRRNPNPVPYPCSA